jgi:hypothetical protein
MAKKRGHWTMKRTYVAGPRPATQLGPVPFGPPLSATKATPGPKPKK